MDWRTLLLPWEPLIPENATPWILSKFGEVFVTQHDAAIGVLQVGSFAYKVVADDARGFTALLADANTLNDWFLVPLVAKLEGAGRALIPDYCYSFIQPPALGGAFVPENVMAIPIAEHFGCWGHVFQQIKDLPDGTQVILTTKPDDGSQP
jgi:hypothetical protein